MGHLCWKFQGMTSRIYHKYCLRVTKNEVPGFWACKFHLSWDNLFICFSLIGCVVTVEDIGHWIFCGCSASNGISWFIESDWLFHQWKVRVVTNFLSLTTARFYLCQLGQWHLPPPLQLLLDTFPDGLGATFFIFILCFDFFIFICLLMVSFVDVT